MERRVYRIRKRDKPMIVYIGLDFGTSYTKAAYYLGAGRKGIVTFSKDKEAEFLPSVVYYDKNKKTLSMQVQSSQAEEIRYFKYTMLKGEALFYNAEKKSFNNEYSNFYELCSVYFLSQCLLLIKDHLQKENPEVNFKWNINMGVPLDNFSESNDKYLYDRVLKAAYDIFQENIRGTMCLSDVYKYYSHDYEEHSSLKTFPELYAEAFPLLKDTSVQDGLYIIIDIGGGTVDAACLRIAPRNEEDSKRTIEFITKMVVPYGLEILQAGVSRKQNKILNLEEYNKILDNVKDKMPEEKWPYKFDVDPFDALCKIFNGMLIDKKEEIKKNYGNKDSIDIPYVFTGGAADVSWYKNAIHTCISPLRGGGIKDLVSKKIKDILSSSHTQNLPKERLLIAESLACRPSEIPDIKGFPWHYPTDEKRKECEPGESTREEKLEDIQRERYAK